MNTCLHNQFINFCNFIKAFRITTTYYFYNTLNVFSLSPGLFFQVNNPI